MQLLETSTCVSEIDNAAEHVSKQKTWTEVATNLS